MKRLPSILVLLLTIQFVSIENVYAKPDKIICYYESWASSYPPRDINTKICTHVNYAFLGVKSDGSLHGGNDYIIKQVAALKKISAVKLLFSVGGWNEGSAVFSGVAKSAAKRRRMANSAVQYINKYKFDGIDIDWEYPAQREGSSAADKHNFVKLLKDIRSAIGTNRLLTIAVSSTPEDKSYDVKEISKIVNYINVMTYDFHEVSQGKTGQNAPLFPSSSDKGWARKNLNCDSAIKNWLSKGAPLQQIVLGLAFYGRSFKLQDSSQHGLGAPTSGAGMNDGYVPYNKICQLTGKDGWKEVFDNEQKVPYKYKGDQWIGYDNSASIRQKVTYAKNKNLAGVMIWAVDNDDNKGTCGTKNALIKEIKHNI